MNMIIVEILAHPVVLITLAMFSATVKLCIGQTEHAIPRFIIGFVYLFILCWPDMPEELRRYLVMWSLLLMLIAEDAAWVLRNHFLRKMIKRYSIHG